jgi:O-antigen/teichoic acid export membrane protein
MRGKAVIKSFSHALTASVATSIVAAISLLVLPKFLGVEAFSYWQLYLFYVTYVGVFHFGWADGIYLRYGGRYYEELDKKSMNSQFWLLFLTETILMVLIALWAILFVHNSNKEVIVIFVGVNCLLLNTRAFLQFTLQGTGRIKDFAQNVVIEKVLFILLAIIGLLAGVSHFEYFLVMDIIAKLVMLVSLCIICKDIVFVLPYKISNYIGEAFLNIISGAKLLLAGIASLLIVGVFRLAIENQWDIITFGKISLVLSVTSTLMILINAASVAIFPAIKRVALENQDKIYVILRTLLMVISLGFLIIYYPLYLVLIYWLPDYKDALMYLSILLPLCVYETKNQFLVNTYMKAFREERTMMTVNLISLAVAVFTVYLTAYIMHDLNLVLLGILSVIAFRAIAAEVMLQRKMKTSSLKDIIYESILVLVFLIASILVGGWIGTVIYAAVYSVYIIVKKQSIVNSIQAVLNQKAKM